jgi:hypothetical protein
MLEFAAVIADTNEFVADVEKLPCFRTSLYHDRIEGEPYALCMHQNLLREISRGVSHTCMRESQLAIEFGLFLQKHDLKPPVTAAGKNFGSFDYQFLKLVQHMDLMFLHRSLDPAILFLLPTDEKPPDLATCLERAGYTGIVHHDALSDARDVVRCLQSRLA